LKKVLCFFFKKEALFFCSFLKKRTKKLLDDLASAWATQDRACQRGLPWRLDKLV
jgi:hypothetical protein